MVRTRAKNARRETPKKKCFTGPRTEERKEAEVLKRRDRLRVAENVLTQRYMSTRTRSCAAKDMDRSKTAARLFQVALNRDDSWRTSSNAESFNKNALLVL